LNRGVDFFFHHKRHRGHREEREERGAFQPRKARKSRKGEMNDECRMMKGSGRLYFFIHPSAFIIHPLFPFVIFVPFVVKKPSPLPLLSAPSVPL
jgi:hypothetical protein